MKRIAITGAGSFIGQALTACADALGWEPVLVTRPGHSLGDGPSSGRFVELAMEDYARLGEAVGPCDCLVLLAWNGTRGAARMDAALQQRNLDTSLTGIRSALAAGCRRIVLAGSQAEYGLQDGPITEESVCHPNTEYGRAKLALYRQAEALCRERGAVLAEPRFFSVYGPGDYPGTMVSSILRDMRFGRPCRLTLGVQLWDFVYITDAARALAMLCREGCPGGIYNIGSGDCRPLREYVLEMADITATTSALEFGAVPYPETGMVSICPDITKLKALGWSPEVSFSEGVRRMLSSMEHTGG